MMAWFIVQNSNLKLIPVWMYFFLSTVLHGLLDALTNGGDGIAFFSPFSNERFSFIHNLLKFPLQILNGSSQDKDMKSC